MVRSMQTVHLSCIKIITISKLTKTSFHLSLLPKSTIGCVQNGFLAYDAFFPNLHLSCIETNFISKQTEARFRITCVSRLISKHLVCSMQTVHLSCIKISTISKQTEPSIHLSTFT